MANRPDERGLFNQDRLPRGWKELLDRWIDIASHPEWGHKHDCGWWYGERASVSQLAGAAWTMATDGWAMTEYSWSRGIVVDEASRARIDLCVQAKKGELRSVIEAKQIWPRLGADDPRPMIDAAIREAEGQLWSGSASKLAEHEAYDHVAVVFVVPTIAVGEVEEHHRLLSRFREDVAGLSAYGGAWAFPPWAAVCVWKDYAYPGVAIVVKSILPRPLDVCP